MKNIQQSGNMYGKHITLKQMNKTEARKRFAKGEVVYFQSCNYFPFGVWQNAMPIELDKASLQSAVEIAEWNKINGYEPSVHPATAEGQFEMMCNNFEYYNTDSERGYYANFYKEI